MSTPSYPRRPKRKYNRGDVVDRSGPRKILPELKAFDTLQLLTLSTTTPQFAAARADLVQGTALYERIGTQAHIKSLYVRGWATISEISGTTYDATIISSGTQARPTIVQVARLRTMLVIDKQSNAAAVNVTFATSDTIANSGIGNLYKRAVATPPAPTEINVMTCQRNLEYRERFTILWEKTMTMTYYDQPAHYWEQAIPVDFVQTYATGSTNPNKNAVYFICFIDYPWSASPVQNFKVFIEQTWRMRYTDC